MIVTIYKYLFAIGCMHAYQPEFSRLSTNMYV
jgi:hypothetical protein